MDTLKFTIIKSQDQYDKYCEMLENLLVNDDKKYFDEIELLTLLIEKWDSEQNTFNDMDPIELLKFLMSEHNLKAKDLVDILKLSKGTISKILNFNKGLSKDTIRRLSHYFKVSQEAFNRPYKLKNELNRHFRNASLMNTRKNMLESGEATFA
ncbi:MAG: transcriptional regulator [Bacteroidetes bacterium]|nr:transcriptional regulator [Bacteroidota bacterium]MBT5530605.1 transcriptional regulator [Cytophagia bacterium]MBT3422620.1 transcriptional regulator [Bacteroidota bacterium]MBT3934680.1 transcriptional regulator [Bacteroidota bacterium]MBT4337160.1 transcriptional regulator [Bacteroidota bacterium]